MVLQNKYKQAASKARLGQQAVSSQRPRPAPPARLETPNFDQQAQTEDSEDEDKPTFTRRVMGSNAERYREETSEEIEDEELALAGQLGPFLPPKWNTETDRSS